MFLAQPSKVLREILAYPIQQKGHVFLAEPQRAGEILAYPFQKKRPRFPFSCPDPRRFLGESLRILFNIERPRLVVCLTQGESDLFYSCTAKESCEGNLNLRKYLCVVRRHR